MVAVNRAEGYYKSVTSFSCHYLQLSFRTLLAAKLRHRSSLFDLKRGPSLGDLIADIEHSHILYYRGFGRGVSAAHDVYSRQSR